MKIKFSKGDFLEIPRASIDSAAAARGSIKGQSVTDCGIVSAKHLSRLIWPLGGLLIAAFLALVYRAWAERPPPNFHVVDGHSVTHARGVTPVPRRPERTVVFDVAALDTLQALGVEVYGVAGDLFPGYLSQYRSARYPRLGSLFDPDYEALDAAKPDLIITGGRSSAKYARIARFAPTVELPMPGDQFIATVVSNTHLLASMFQREAKASELIETLRTSIAELRPKAARGGRGLVVLTTGGKMTAYGPGSRFGLIYADFGVPPAEEKLESSLHGEAIGSEFILKTNPEWLFVIDRDTAVGQAGSAQQLLDNELVHQTTAWKRGQIIYLDAASTYLAGGGIQSTQQLVDAFARAYAKSQPSP